MSLARTYLDWNASAPLREEARVAALAALGLTGNASSVHGEGRRARALIEDARESVAALVGADPADVIFTSGGTEANVTALAPQNAGGAGEVAAALVSAVEHPSVLAGGRFPVSAVRRVPVTAQGVVDLDRFARLVAEQRAQAPQAGLLVSVMVANNETGAVQPVAQVAAIARAHGAVVHADAVQAAGKMPLDMAALGADMLSLSAHKIGGPQGAGALVLASPEALKDPLLKGGGQELRRRAGTENVAAIAGFGAAAACAKAEVDALPRIRRLRDALEAAILAEAADAVIFAREAERLPNTTCFAVPGMAAETAVIGLDLAGVAVSAGAACSSGRVQLSHVLAAMGVDPSLAAAAIRVSLGTTTQADDIERFLAVWSALKRQIRERRSAA